MCDLLVHRDLPLVGAPRLKLVDLMCGEPAFPMFQNARQELRMPARLEELDRPAHLACSHIPRYRAMVEEACARLGCSPADFRGHRLVLEHPPIPMASVLVYPQVPPPG